MTNLLSPRPLLSGLMAASVALACLGIASPAAARDDTTVGAEFIDMPETAEGEEPQPVSDEKVAPGYVPGYRQAPSIGLSPFVPQGVEAMPGGVTPNFGAPLPEGNWRFDFSGYLSQPLVAGIGTRENASEIQNVTTLHGDPVVPGSAYGFFDHTNTVPGPWSQVNFHYGNSTVRATAILGAWRTAQSQLSGGYFNPAAQQWFTNALLTYTPDVAPVGLNVRVGAYQDRYGPMAKYSSGVYGLALIGEINGVGTTSTLSLPFENGVTFTFEGGLKGEFDKAPHGIPAENSTQHAREMEGSTYAAHGHFNAAYEEAELSAHYIYTWSQDSRVDDAAPIDSVLLDEEGDYPRDGSISVLGADFRMDAHRFGYLYFGGAYLKGQDSITVSNLVKFLNVGSGKDFGENFWGLESDGNGSLSVLGMQYTLSLGTLLRYPREFWGDGPDLQLTLFGMYGHSDSVWDEVGERDALKYGTEAFYSMTPWLAASLRLDHVLPDLETGGRSFGVITPKIIFRDSWRNQASVTIQYSGYVLGDDVVVEGDSRLLNAGASDNPDQHVLAVYGTMWW